MYVVFGQTFILFLAYKTTITYIRYHIMVFHYHT